MTSVVVRTFVCALVLALVGLAEWPRAQAPASGPQYVSDTRYTIARGQMEAFRQFVIKEWNPLVKKGGLTERHFFIQRTGEGSVVIMSTPSKGPAQLDEPGYLQKATASDSKTRQAIIDKLSRFIESSESSLLQVRTDLTYVPPNPAAYKASEVLVYQIVPGQQAVWEEGLKTLVGAAKQAKLGRWVATRTSGGPTGEVVSVNIYTNFADVAKGNALQRTMGAAEFQKWQQRLLGTITNVRSYLLEYDAEMSFAPATPPSEP
jgi:hypothetical protein